MEEVEVRVRLQGSASPDRVASAVASAAAAEGLSIRLQITLRTYAGSVHWHLGRPGERGTLEATWWPAGKRLWLAVHSNRRAAWIEGTLPQLQSRLEQALG
jgi:hypothetical protein